VPHSQNVQEMLRRAGAAILAAPMVPRTCSGNVTARGGRQYGGLHMPHPRNAQELPRHVGAAILAAPTCRTPEVLRKCSGNATARRGRDTGGLHVLYPQSAHDMFRTCSGNAAAHGGHNTGSPHVPYPKNAQEMHRKRQGNAAARGGCHPSGPHVPCPRNTQEMLRHAEAARMVASMCRVPEMRRNCYGAGAAIHVPHSRSAPEMLRKCCGMQGPPCWRPPWLYPQCAHEVSRKCSGNAAARGGRDTGGPHMPYPRPNAQEMIRKCSRNAKEMQRHAGPFKLAACACRTPQMLRKCYGPPHWWPPRAGPPKCSRNAHEMLWHTPSEPASQPSVPARQSSCQPAPAGTHAPPATPPLLRAEPPATIAPPTTDHICTHIQVYTFRKCYGTRRPPYWWLPHVVPPKCSGNAPEMLRHAGAAVLAPPHAVPPKCSGNAQEMLRHAGAATLAASTCCISKVLTKCAGNAPEMLWHVGAAIPMRRTPQNAQEMIRKSSGNV